MSLEIHILDKNLSQKVKGFDSLTDFEPKLKLLAQVVRCELMNFRSGNAHTKTRAEVRGGGKKPWKQKGTGRARHGSIRSPLWVGGGVTFGPRNNRNWHLKINKSARVSALKSIIKDRLDHSSVYLFEDEFDYPKTKLASEILDNFNQKTESKIKQTAIIYATEEKTKIQGFVNTEVKMINASNLKISELARATKFVMTPKAKEILENRFK